jgi:phosphinothricin acetyltransferase
MRIRDARPEDAAAIAAIYNDAVVHTTAVWNDAPVDALDRVSWMTQRQAAGLPVLVSVDDADEAIGFATYGPWRPHDGYRHTVEHSVYVRSDQRGVGLGRALMEALITRARAAGVHVMVAGIEAGNTGSIGLHERFGFVEVGRLPQVGVKFDRWLDLVFLQLTLDDAPAPGRGIHPSPTQENA